MVVFLGHCYTPTIRRPYNKGTQFFWPLEYRLAYKNIFVVDPLYTVPFLVFLLIALFHKRTNPRRRFFNNIGLIVSTTYMMLTLVFKWISFEVLIQEAEALGANTTVLLENVCDQVANVTGAIFDDNGEDLVCGTADPAISGTVKPSQSLGSSAGKSSLGTWLLVANDNTFQNGGTFTSGSLDGATITVCTAEANTSVLTKLLANESDTSNAIIFLFMIDESQLKIGQLNAQE